MAKDKQALREWHRLFGLLLTDFFTGTPFTVELERDLSKQKQLLDVLILHRGSGRFVGRLPDGLEDLVARNLITFKSHREALDAWAMKELVGHYVAYRKFASTSPSDLLPEDQFRLYAVCARFPQNLSGQVPWHERQPGVYDCKWGTDVIRVIAAGELPREAHNAPLHLFSASPELVGFGCGAYRQRSGQTSRLLEELFEGFAREGFAMPYTMEDFNRDYVKKTMKRFAQLTPEQQREALESLPPEERREVLESLAPEVRREALQSLSLAERLAGLSAEQIRQYLDTLPPGRPSQSQSRKPRRKR